MARISVLYLRNGHYGEFNAKSSELTEQQMVDEMYSKSLPGLAFRFLGESGVILPTGCTGDHRLYIESPNRIPA